MFIEFMPSAIKASLIEAISLSDVVSDEAMDKAPMRSKHIETFLESYELMMNADVRMLCNLIGF